MGLRTNHQSKTLIEPTFRIPITHIKKMPMQQDDCRKSGNRSGEAYIG
jgi:hypothetical protein